MSARPRAACFGLLAAAALGAGVASAAAPDELAGGVPWRERIDWHGRSSRVRVSPGPAPLKAYRFTALAADGAVSERTVQEPAGRPFLRSGNPLFDGLFALALEEAAEDSVDAIADGQFNDGRPVSCHCFETGAEWHYVWTRDLAYSVDLGLAMLDPDRARNSLLFKQSGLRPELTAAGLAARTLVVQDTGSGGSWPVSTDRVAWIHAASAVLAALPAAEATQLVRVVYPVARDTLLQDRTEVFDARVGLYRGETSFLDWREQTYPPWTRANTRFLAESYALSTNVLEYVALLDASRLAQQLGDERAGQFAAWSEALRAAINARFWRDGEGLYATVVGPAPGLLPLPSYDLLGLSLAIIHGIADGARARRSLEAYPVAAAGPPVVWPEQPGVPIYHNRALWPFVTAYALAAAKAARAPEHASRAAESLVRGAALSLSNMENFEFLTQATRYADGALSGPVINSRRQLWSVAGYFNMVVRSLWGVEFLPDAVRFDPWLPAALAHTLFEGGATLALNGLERAGATFSVALVLPERWPDTGWLEAATVVVNGTSLRDPREPVGPWAPGTVNEVVIRLKAAAADATTGTRVPPEAPLTAIASDSPRWFAPAAPAIARVQRSRGHVRLDFAGLVAGSELTVYRDGAVRAGAVHGAHFEEDLGADSGTVCYVATQRAGLAGLESLPTDASCVAGPGSRWRGAAGGALRSPDGHPLAAGGREFADWGAPREALEAEWVAAHTGLHRLRLEYANANGPVNTGITAAFKRVLVSCASDLAQPGSIVMPQLPAGVYALSTQMLLEAHAGERCRIRVSDDFNMSYLEHFQRYTAGRGGRTGPLNQASIRAVEIDWLGAAIP